MWWSCSRSEQTSGFETFLWLLPIVSLIVNPLLYVPNSKNGTDICYLHGNGLVFGLLLPIGVVILVNLIMFGMENGDIAITTISVAVFSCMD